MAMDSWRYVAQCRLNVVSCVPRCDVCVVGSSPVLVSCWSAAAVRLRCVACRTMNGRIVDRATS